MLVKVVLVLISFQILLDITNKLIKKFNIPFLDFFPPRDISFVVLQVLRKVHFLERVLRVAREFFNNLILSMKLRFISTILDPVYT